MPNLTIIVVKPVLSNRSVIREVPHGSNYFRLPNVRVDTVEWTTPIPTVTLPGIR